jgi:hypothetical protein
MNERLNIDVGEDRNPEQTHMVTFERGFSPECFEGRNLRLGRNPRSDR